MHNETQMTSSPSDGIVTESLRGPRLHEFTPPAQPYLERLRELVGERAALGSAVS